MIDNARYTAAFISHVRLASVYVSDQDAALDFYVNKLGFEKRSDTTYEASFRWIDVAPVGSETALTLVRADMAAYGNERIGKFVGVVFDTNDVQALYEKLTARGVRFTQRPTRQRWGMVQAQFIDQDGNGFLVIERDRPTSECPA